MATDLDVADLDELATRLRAAGVRSVDIDPAKVNAPGVWIRFDGIRANLLDGLTVLTTLHLVVPHGEPHRAAAALAVLWNKVAPVLADLGGPNGDVRHVGVAMPDSTVLPALAAPLEMLTS